MHLEYGNNVGSDENCDCERCKLIPFCTEKRTIHHSAYPKCLQLRFLSSKRMPDVVYTGNPIVGEDASMEVALVDGLTGNVVKSGSEASEEVEILVLDKAFNKNYMDDDWTSEEYGKYILQGRKGKIPVLRTTCIRLLEGRGSLSHIKFRHSSNSLRKIEVRLGARIVRAVDQFSNGTRIREAISEPFIVKHRRQMNKKDYHLSFTDPVSRLRNIGRKCRDILRRKEIHTVKDFLALHRKGPQELKRVLGKAISAQELEATINQANACEHHMRKNLHTSEAKHDALEVVSDVQKAEGSDMVIASSKNLEESFRVDSISSLLVANSNGTKISDSMNTFGKPFNTLGFESTLGAFYEDEFLWHRIDRDSIIRAFFENEHRQFYYPNFNPFQSNTFCSPADVRKHLGRSCLR